MSQALAGAYLVDTDTVFVVDSNIHAVSSLHELNEEESEYLRILVIAHELAHALQQQHTNAYHRLLQQTEQDTINAFGAVFEGHAQLIHSEVARALGIRPEISDLVGEMPVANEYVTPMERILAEQLRAHQSFKYDVGESFVRQTLETGALESLWEVVLNPPTKTVQLVGYDSKPQDQQALDEFSSKLFDLLGHYYGTGCSFVERSLGYLDLYIVYQGRATKPGSNIVDRVREGRSYSVNCDGRQLQDSIVLVWHKDDSGGEGLRTELLRFSDLQLKNADGKNGLSILSSKQDIVDYGAAKFGSIEYEFELSGNKSRFDISRWVTPDVYLEWFRKVDAEDRLDTHLRESTADFILRSLKVEL